MGAKDADRVRSFVQMNYITPARAQGNECISICARDVHARMGFKKNNYPNICQALQGPKLLQMANVRLVKVVGTNPGPNAYFCYELQKT
jgi:5-methylcytosine-specific restriction enzyme B